MSTIALPVQHVLFPSEERFLSCTCLFYRDKVSEETPQDRLVLDKRRWRKRYQNGEFISTDTSVTTEDLCSLTYDPLRALLHIPANTVADFSCYLNMFSAKKWFTYTHAESLSLELTFRGCATVSILAYDLDDFRTIKQMNSFMYRRDEGIAGDAASTSVLFEKTYNHAQAESAVVELGACEHTLIAFRFETNDEPVDFFGGTWKLSADESHVRTVDLAIATTTFKKEEYISKNIGLFKDMIAHDSELKQHMQMFVVDNGKSLDAHVFEDENVYIYPNDNVGGSGGFARGMIEALRAKVRPTNLIIMDDDVLVLPESFRKTYYLLKLIKDEYSEHFISGAMLRMKEMETQHEDIGFVHNDGYFMSKKGPMSFKTILDCAANEVSWPVVDHEYAAWWYCCIPVKTIAAQGLPLPLFIRGDDAEYSVRCESKIISMNGICVWHMGFEEKFNANMEYYQVIKNALIIQALNPSLDTVTFYNWTKVLCNRLTGLLAYDYVDLILDAIEDYLDGPDQLRTNKALKIIQKKAKSNEVMKPLGEVWDKDIDFEPILGTIKEDPASIMLRKLITFSLNGHKFFATFVRDETGVIPYDWEFNWGDILFKQQLLAVDPLHGSAILRKRDMERYKQLKQRRDRVYERYECEHKQIDAMWRAEQTNFTSHEFWMRYLGIE